MPTGTIVFTKRIVRESNALERWKMVQHVHGMPRAHAVVPEKQGSKVLKAALNVVFITFVQDVLD